MKSMLRAILIGMLCLCFASTAGATAVHSVRYNTTQNDGESLNVQSMAIWEDMLYLLTPDGIYRYLAEEGKSELVASFERDESAVEGDTWAIDTNDISTAESEADSSTEGENAQAGQDGDAPKNMTSNSASVGNSVDMLIPGDDALYALNSTTGELFRLKWADKKLSMESVVKLDWSDMVMQIQGYPMARARNRAVLEGDCLYLLRMDDDYMTNALMKFDIKTGKGAQLSGDNIASIAPYKDGSLLAMAQVSYDEPVKVVAIDMSSGNASTLFEGRNANDFGAQYDAANDTIYFMSDGELYAKTGSQSAQVVAYIPVSNVWESAPTALLPSGYYAVYAGGSLTVRSTDPAQKPEHALRISGLYSDDIASAFAKDHPEIPLVMSTKGFENAEKLTANMMSGDAANDLYVLNLAYEQYEALVEKGYAADLSVSETIKAAIEAMYPGIGEILTKNGKIYAVPQYFSASAMGYSPQVLETIGLTEDDLPKTYIELMEFINRWEDEFAKEYPDLTLFENPDKLDLQSSLFGSIFMDYMLYYQRLGEDLVFDTPLFRKLLETLGNTDFSGFMQPDPNEGDENGSTVAISIVVSGEDMGPTALFSQYKDAALTGFPYDNGYKLMPLALDEGMDACIGANLDVFIVNPNSQNADLAIQFLEYYVNHLSGAMKSNLMPGENEPVPNQSYNEMLSNVQTALDEAQAAYDKAVGTQDEKMMELNLQSAQNMVDFIKKYEWNVTKEDIEAYRAIYDKLVINRGNIFYDGGGEQSQELATIVQRYIGGEMQVDQLVRELDKKIKMMMMEGN